MHVADVARVVVAGNDDEAVALDPVQVVLRERVLLLEAEGRQVAGADDDVRCDVVHLGDRAFEQIREEELRPAVQIRDLHDCERPVPRRHTRSLGRPDPLLLWFEVTLETPDFQAYRGQEPPRFANRAELECAKVLDYYGVPWQYEPTTFVLEEDEDGRIVEAFKPDFYLPEQDLYVEVTVMKQSLVTRKNRKLRKLRERYPEVRVKLFYKRDIERLAERYRLELAS